MGEGSGCGKRIFGPGLKVIATPCFFFLKVHVHDLLFCIFIVGFGYFNFCLS